MVSFWVRLGNKITTVGNCVYKNFLFEFFFTPFLNLGKHIFAVFHKRFLRGNTETHRFLGAQE